MKKLIDLLQSLSSKTIILVVAAGIFISCASTVFGQPSIQWQKSFGGNGADQANAIQQTQDSGYIIAGKTLSGNNGDVSGVHGGLGFDYWIVKTNSLGVLQWQKCLGGTSIETACSIKQTSDGGYIVAGNSSSNDFDVSGNHGGNDFWIVKIDQSGNIQWQKSLGGTGIEIAYSIEQTSDGGYIIAGVSNSNDFDVSGNHGGNDYWIVKIDQSGNIQWQNSFGGSLNDEAYSVRQTSDGGYIVAGLTNSNDGNVSSNHGATDCWIVKINSVGTIQWQRSLGGTGNDEAYSIQQTQDSGYIIAGITTSNNGDVSGNHGNTDYWVVKIDQSGTIQWQRCFGGSSGERASSIKKTSDGGYIVAGISNSSNGNVSSNYGNFDYWIVKSDSVGNIQWEKSLGGSNTDEAKQVQQTFDGGYIVTGSSMSNDFNVTGNHGSYDYWVVKLICSDTIYSQVIFDSTWVNCVYNLSTDTSVLIQVDTVANFIITTVDSMFIDSIVTWMFIHEDSIVYTLNQCDDSDYDSIQYSVNRSNFITTFDTTIHQHSDTALLVFVEEISFSGIRIYPNPTSTVLYIEAGDKEIEYKLLDLKGQLILSGRGKKIDMNNFPVGMYFLRIFTNDYREIFSQKVIKK